MLAATLVGALAAPPAVAAEPAPPTAEAPPSDRAAFEALVEEARLAREAGRLEDALSALRHAYALSRSAAVLNNVGVLLEELGRYDEALASARDLAAHPALPPGRRAAVAARVATLEEKAGRAWVRVLTDPGAAVRTVAGAVDATDEIALEPGRTLVFVLLRDRHVAIQTGVTAQRGQRADVDLTEAAARASLGCYDVGEMGVPALLIDRGPWDLVGPDAVTRVYVDPGARLVAVPGGDGRRVEVGAGEVLTLAAGPPSGDDGVAPLFTGAAGVIVAGVGLGLYVDAEHSRDTLRASLAAEPVDGPSRATALSRQRAADDQATSGAVVIGVGAVIVAGGLLWWALAEDGPPTIEVHGNRAAWTVRF